MRHGVRPLDFGLAADDDGVPATVGVVEPTGAETLVYSMGANMETCAQFVERHAFVPGQENGLAPRSKGLISSARRRASGCDAPWASLAAPRR